MNNPHTNKPPPSESHAVNALSWSNLVAQLAEQVSLTVSPLIAVLTLGSGAGEIGLLALVQSLPFFLFSIPLGLWADRHRRRPLMLVSEGVRLVSLVGLLVMSLTGTVSIALLAALGFIGALGTVGFSVGGPALLPLLATGGALARANARLELARSIAYAAGPAAAGALVTWAGASTAFALAAVLSAAGIGLMLRVHEPSRTIGPERHPLIEIREGVQQVWRDNLLRPVMLTSMVWNISWFVLQSAYLPYAVRSLGLSADLAGLTLAAYGIGMVAGALMATRIIGSMQYGSAILLGPVISVVAAGIMVATLVFPSAWLAAGSYFLFGAGPIVWTITSVTLRQTITPSALIGRVTALFLAVNMGARPLGAAIGAGAGSLFGESVVLMLALAGFVLQAILIVSSEVRRLERLPRA